jgi:hypothetical protein
MDPQKFLREFAASQMTIAAFADKTKIGKNTLAYHVQRARNGLHGKELESLMKSISPKESFQDASKKLIKEFAEACAADPKMTPEKFADPRNITTSSVRMAIKRAREGRFGTEYRKLVPFKAHLYLGRNTNDAEDDAIETLRNLGK